MLRLLLMNKIFLNVHLNLSVVSKRTVAHKTKTNDNTQQIDLNKNQEACWHNFPS